MGGSSSERRRAREIYRRLDAAYPSARLALDYDGPFQLLVALILAAQCTDRKVNEVTPGLFRRFPDPASIAEAKSDLVEEMVRPTGFYRQKTRTLQSCCRQLIERFGGEVPDRQKDLLTLPGVGRKTANILLGNAFGVPGIGVDTHVARLSQRIGFTTQRDPDKIEADLAAVVPEDLQIRFCHLLQQHGRTTCIARRPKCPDCVIESLCRYPDKTPPAARKEPPKRSRWV